MHQTIDTEVAIVGVVAEVTTISPVVLTIRALCQQALVFEVPDELTRQTGILLVEVEHLTDITHRVTHRVRVLTLDVRTVLLVHTLILYAVIIPIHGRGHIGIVATTFIVSQTGLVEFLNSCLHSSEIIAVTTFITERPHKDADVIAHPANVVLRALYHRILKLRHMREIPVAVTLDICLSQHVHSVFVAEVIEHRIIGIMRGADGINIQALHAENILFNFFWGDSTAVNRRKIVTIDAVEHHSLTIDKQGTIIANTYLTEANLRATTINNLTLCIFQCQHKVIEVRCLCTPLVGSSDIHIQAQLSSHRGRSCRNG